VTVEGGIQPVPEAFVGAGGRRGFCAPRFAWPLAVAAESPEADGRGGEGFGRRLVRYMGCRKVFDAGRLTAERV
jgi:hypothetical protein